MADRLDMAIAAKRREYTELQRAAAALEAELRVLEAAAKIKVPLAAGNADPHTNGSRSGGRKKGSIAHAWRAVFRDMVKSGHANDPEEIHKFAIKQGIKITLKSTATRARDYAKLGYLERRDTGYWVPQETIKRFNL